MKHAHERKSTRVEGKGLEKFNLVSKQQGKKWVRREREGGRGAILPVAAKTMSETQNASSKSGQPKSPNKRHSEK